MPLAEGIERGLGLGGPVGCAGAKGAGGQRLVAAHLLGVVGSRLAPVCKTGNATQHFLSLERKSAKLLDPLWLRPLWLRPSGPTIPLPVSPGRASEWPRLHDY